MLFRWTSPLAKILSALFVLASVAAWAQSPDGNTAILERLDRLEKQNRELLEEIKQLREQIQKSAAPTNSTGEEKAEVNEHRVDELAQTKVEASQKFPIQLTGMALFNAFLNGRYGGSAQYPVVAGLNEGQYNNGGSFRQSIIGFHFQGPTTLLGGKISGSLYLDLFGGSGQSLNQIVRLRIAKIQADWARTTISFGQDKPLISQREPNSLAQIGVSPLTAAGNPWLWLPQVRLEQRFPVAPKFLWKAEAAILQTNEYSNVPASAMSLIESPRPAFETRVSARYQWNENQTIELGTGAHTSTTHFNGFSVPSRLFTIDWFIKPEGWLEFKGLFFRGRNFASLGALGGLTQVGTIPLAIGGVGGWSEVRFIPTSRLTFNLYGGQQDDQNRNLLTGMIGKNQAYAANVTYLLAPNVLGSIEVGQVRTTYLGIGNRLNNHYDLAIAYLF
ncbi:MAG: hypothetical protein JOZ45_08675 [Acidobacteriaceae bacterium]|nr:hypothetical protein [Acidobacteriaceae bacterium]MBV9306201.1 hypothetical protein [Acidobacteriaceae bacterium]